MNAKQTDATVKAVMTGLMVAGAAFVSVGTIGCDRLVESQVTMLASGPVDEVVWQLGSIKYTELSSKITFNHNETSLSGDCA